jgi:RIO-like serine/threonine protein kinase
MEGACGRIISTDDPNVVIKHVYHRNRPQQRNCSLRAEEQAQMQEFARRLCIKAGFQMLFVPRAWDATKHAYKMDRIDVSSPLEMTDVKDHAVLEELKAFYAAAMVASVFPMDYELYVQPDGKIAMVDFDKFSSWKDGTITFPWGLVLKDSVMREQFPFLFA